MEYTPLPPIYTGWQFSDWRDTACTDPELYTWLGLFHTDMCPQIPQYTVHIKEMVHVNTYVHLN